MAELVAAGIRGRAATLSRHGFTEETWAELDLHWQTRLSEALEPFDDDVPELFSAYAAAYADAQRELAGPVSLEQLAEVTRRVQLNGDLAGALAHAKISLSDFVEANARWSRKMIEDPEVEQAFTALLKKR